MTLGWGSVQFPCKREGCTYLETKYGANTNYKIDHDYVVISDTATCTKAGTIKKICVRERTDGEGEEYNGKMVCGKTLTTTSPAKGHTWGKETVVMEGDCFSRKCVSKTCSVCGAVELHYYDRNGAEVPAKDQSEEIHEWNTTPVKTVAPTCTKDGYKLYTCKYATGAEDDLHTDNPEAEYKEIL